MARILFLLAESTSSGIHDYAYYRMLEEGHDVVVAAAVKKPTRTVVIFAGGADGAVDLIRAASGLVHRCRRCFRRRRSGKLDALVIPGGPSTICRANRRCVEIVRQFIDNDKPVTGICTRPNVILEALHQAGNQEQTDQRECGARGGCARPTASGYTSRAKP